MHYAVNFCDGNYTNDLNIAIVDKSITKNNIHGSYVYSNIDNTLQNLTLRLLFAIKNIKTLILILNISTIIILY